MKKLILTAIFIITMLQFVFATHNRVGYITYSWISGFTYKVSIITYTKASSVNADRDSLPIIWGDGASDKLARTKANILSNDIKFNEYSWTHTYPGYGTFIISMTDPNRLADICNINNGNSVNEPFIIEAALIVFDPIVYSGQNSSPVFLTPPTVDLAFPNQLFQYNPNVYDADDDSLSFELIQPLGTTNYVTPNLIGGTTGNRTFLINSLTGEIKWDAPQFCCIYNIAVLMKEWRRVSGKKPLFIGSSILDMQIIVSCKGDIPSSSISNSKNDISIYPNPVTNNLFITSYSSSTKEIELKDILSRSIYRQPITSKQTSIDVSLLNAGIYFAIFKSEDGSVTTRKFVKE